MRKNIGFTLIELLVVVTIVTILMALLLPTLRSARESAYDESCKAKMKHLYLALWSYSQDYASRLPGYDWCSYRNYGYEYGPHGGTVFPYVTGFVSPYYGQQIYENRPEIVGSYRCPGLPLIKVKSKVGSNGHFDYTLVTGFTLVRTSNLPATCQRLSLSGTTWEDGYSTPLLCEQKPYYLNATGPAVQWYDSQMAHRHFGACNTATTTGAVKNIFEPINGKLSTYWRAKDPAGTIRNFDTSWYTKAGW